ncbi:hypothetical protein BJX70DRAFT_40091 [Aspergillus crustosus]
MAHDIRLGKRLYAAQPSDDPTLIDCLRRLGAYSDIQPAPLPIGDRDILACPIQLSTGHTIVFIDRENGQIMQDTADQILVRPADVCISESKRFAIVSDNSAYRRNTQVQKFSSDADGRFSLVCTKMVRLEAVSYGLLKTAFDPYRYLAAGLAKPRSLPVMWSTNNSVRREDRDRGTVAAVSRIPEAKVERVLARTEQREITLPPKHPHHKARRASFQPRTLDRKICTSKMEAGCFFACTRDIGARNMRTLFLILGSEFEPRSRSPSNKARVPEFDDEKVETGVDPYMV